jgi:hypothetical protein
MIAKGELALGVSWQPFFQPHIMENMTFQQKNFKKVKPAN